MRRDSDDLQRELAAIWEAMRPRILGGVEEIEDAVAALMAGTLDDATQQRARSAAHKLAGSVGTFGHAEAGARAKELELLFESPLSLGHAPRLSALAVELRARLEQAGAGPQPGARLGLLGVDPQRARALREEAQARGWAVADGPGPPLLLVGGAGDELPERLDGAVTAVLLEPGRSPDRVELLRRGAQRFLPATLSAKEVLDELAALDAARRVNTARVVALDDDPAVLRLLEAALADHDLVLCERPDAFWAALDPDVPDLVILDVQLPGADGIDICRAVRADARWGGVPIVFLTATTDAATISSMFAAGGDDFVAKPVAGPELVARVEARLDRMRLLRRAAEVDALTGLTRRPAALAPLERLLGTADRLGQPLFVAIAGVDGLAELNDRHGPDAGDAALTAAGAALKDAFGEGEVLARWAGGRLLAAMLGLEEHDVRGRLAAVVEAVREHELAPGIGVTLSIGAAAFPRDGTGVPALVEAAQAAREAAATAGGDRVVLAGDAPGGAPPGRADVVLVEDDELLSRLVLHALETRGYTTHLIGDGDTAARVLGGERPQLRAGLVLLDWDLPARDGLTVLRGLAADGALNATPVIMLTGRATEREVLASLELGAADHVPKPFSVPVLMQKVRRVLSR